MYRKFAYSFRITNLRVWGRGPLPLKVIMMIQVITHIFLNLSIIHLSSWHRLGCKSHRTTSLKQASTCADTMCPMYWTEAILNCILSLLKRTPFSRARVKMSLMMWSCSWWSAMAMMKSSAITCNPEMSPKVSSLRLYDFTSCGKTEGHAQELPKCTLHINDSENWFATELCLNIGWGWNGMSFVENGSNQWSGV